MHAVVVDDHDMGVTHVIRGDDHLTNAARQSLIYRALGWEAPVFAHLPLIHGPDGAKLSKRHGATSVIEYRDLGYLPAAVRNYLARLGWSHGDDEFFTDEQAIGWFGLEAVGRSPARFDFAKLESLNGQHIRATADEELVRRIEELFAARGRPALSPDRRAKLLHAMPGLKDRAKTLLEIIDIAHYVLTDRPLSPDAKAATLLDGAARPILARLTARLRDASEWRAGSVEQIVRSFAEDEQIKLGKVAQPLRAALTGRSISPGVFDVMETLGRDETLARLDDAARESA
jgi:glutamyl-tRNA synthetase